MSKAKFDKQTFVGSLPPVLTLAADPPPLPCGAAFPGTEFAIIDRRIILKQVWYTTPKRIHGLLHYDGPTQLFFVGYECGQCGEVFLVPDTVTDEASLARAMRHDCTRAHRPSFDLRTRVLWVVQDIGRPSDLGSVGCEQYADQIMELLEEARP